MMRKAVSPIVATVLLIIIAVAAGVLIWVWLHGFAEKNPTAQPTLQEEIKIDTVNVVTNPSATYPSNVTAYVRNIGSVTANITSAYVLDAVNGNTVCANTSITGVTISPGGVTSVLVMCKTALTSGHPYIVKVVTARGVEATYQFLAP